VLDTGEIIAEFEEHYGLPRDWILDGIQTAFEQVLSELYRRPVGVFLEEESFEVRLYEDRGGVVEERVLPLARIRGWNTIRRRIEFQLRKLAVLRDFENLRPYEGTLVKGRIALVDVDGTLYVQTEIRMGEPITCLCERRCQPPRERKEGYMRGEQRFFRLSKVRGVILEGVPRLKVHLDRMSPELPVLLIQDEMRRRDAWRGDIRVKGVKRIGGAFSLVAATERLPPYAIRRAAEELHERVRVVYGQDALPYFRGRRADDGSDPYRNEALRTPYDADPAVLL
jgi:hypothetical protein